MSFQKISLFLEVIADWSTSYRRVYLAEARLILAKMICNFEMELVDKDDWNWLDQKAYLVFELKVLFVRLKESLCKVRVSKHEGFVFKISLFNMFKNLVIETLRTVERNQ